MTKMSAGSLCPVCRQKNPNSEYVVAHIQGDALKTVLWCKNCNTRFDVPSDLAEVGPVVGLIGGAIVIGKAIIDALNSDNSKKK